MSVLLIRRKSMTKSLLFMFFILSFFSFHPAFGDTCNQVILSATDTLTNGVYVDNWGEYYLT